MERLINAYTVRPSEIQAGDVMLFTVKALVIRPGYYRIYRCKHDSGDEIPQGSRILPEQERVVCEAFFPSLAQVARPDKL